MSDKLPEWPDFDAIEITPDMLEFEPLAQYRLLLAEAALARMEALAKELRLLRHEIDGDVTRFQDLYRIDKLLAACERRSGG